MLKFISAMNAISPIPENASSRWKQLGSIPKRLDYKTIDRLPGWYVQGVKNFAREVDNATKDFDSKIGGDFTPERRHLARILATRAEDFQIVNNEASRLGEAVQDLSLSKNFEGTDAYFNAALRYAEIKMLPFKSDRNQVRPTLVFTRDYYQDEMLRNVDLVHLAHLFARKFGFTDILIPDMNLQYSHKDNETTGFGGYTALRFLDRVDERPDLIKSCFNFLIDNQTHQTIQARKLFDFSKTQLFHSPEDTFVLVDFPSKQEYEILTGERIREKDYVELLEYAKKWFRREGKEDSLILLDDFKSKRGGDLALPRIPKTPEDELDPGRRKLLEMLAPNTPQHVAELLYSHDWYHREDTDTLLLMPSKFNYEIYRYNMNDVSRLAKFFIEQKEGSTKFREFAFNLDMDHSGANKAFFN
jgi:hypothetical protein